MLTDTDKAAAKALGLTLDEARIAKSVRISFEKYAFHKEQIILEREAAQAHEVAFNSKLTKYAAEWIKNCPGRGEPLPPPEEEEV